MKIKDDWRYTSVGFVFALVGALIIGQMIRIQISPDKGEFLNPKTLGEPEHAASRRGLILDRNGKLFAGNTTVYEVTVSILDFKRGAEIYDSIRIEDIKYILDAAIDVFNITDPDTIQLFRTEPYPDRSAVVVEKYATREEVERFLDYVDVIQHRTEEEILIRDDDSALTVDLVDCQDFLGIYCEPHFARSYPEKTLASNILGFVSRNDGQGHLGVEAEYDTTLLGDDRIVKALWNPYLADQSPYPDHGANLILTIDSVLQADVENILDTALQTYGAQAGTIVVMDPKTGDIYAMASAPRIDISEYWHESYFDVINNVDNIFNYAVKAYEPGSVLKVITMAAALDAGVVERDTEFLDTGEFKIGGITIRNWDRRAWGPQTMTTCLQHSLNVCLAWVGSQLGAEQMYAYLQSFGFGQLTGIGLANEAPGVVKNYLSSDWHKSELGTNSFGQGIEVTSVQMLKAVSAIANNGMMVSPRIVRAIVDQEYRYEAPIDFAGSPISEETARTLTEMLTISLEKEASSALVPGYSLAGKTGTAEIYVKGEGYTSNLTNASFIGWGPTDDPQFIVYVWISKPTTAIWGSVVASPIFRQVVDRVIIHLGIPPDAVRHNLQEDI
ncbi:MAG: hypothetical protein B6I38_00300 [Anaerolineaceae bacterium 4572_5.1]|nr:MAG: hypothetical protein B6I38_00300 [Anaerolineaceae bacterium 4572_5.1]